MTIRIWKTATFEAAHFLPGDVQEKFRTMHGHSFLVTATITGGPSEEGKVLDLAFFGAKLSAVVGMLDHCVINERHPEINPPTLERIAEWIATVLGKTMPDAVTLLSVNVERPTCGEGAEWIAP